MKLDRKMVRAALILLFAASCVNVALCWELATLLPIYESEEWRQAHPALAERILEGKTLSNGYTSGIGRVTGGQEATPHQFPYQAGLVVELTTMESFCGGSLISHNFVLTAAHCVDITQLITVLLGAHNVSMHTETDRLQQLIYRNSIIMHEGYNATRFQNDIALLRLNTPVAETPYIQIIQLPRISQESESFANLVATVSGWGRTSDTSERLADTLRYVTVSVMENTGCASMFGEAVTTSSICSSGGNRVGPCGGDSGGPLVVTDGGIRVQVGLVSFGVGFGCSLGWPTVYIRTSQFLDWVTDHSDTNVRF